MTGTDHPGWESRDQVVARFTAGVRFWIAQADDRPLVIASHGMAMTLWLSATVGLTDAGAFWADLRLPDLLAVDVTGRQVTRSVYGDPRASRERPSWHQPGFGASIGPPPCLTGVSASPSRTPST